MEVSIEDRMGAFFVGSADDPGKNIRMGVDRCFSAGYDTWTDRCAVHYSFGVLIIVCILNAIKVACITYTLILFRKGIKNTDQTSMMDSTGGDDSLMTVGDAVASFLKRADDYTKDLPLVTKDDFKKGRWPVSGTDHIAQRYRRLLTPKRWYRAPTLRRWLVTSAWSVSLCVSFSSR